MFRMLTLALCLFATQSLAQESGVSPVLNPLFESPLIETPPQGTSYVAEDWETNDLIIPAPFIWERGGWMWPDHIRTWRLDDERLQWKDEWTKPDRYGQFLRYSEETDLFGLTSRYVHFEDWLPIETAYQCDALLAMTLAMKVHRLTLLPEDVNSLERVKDTVCEKSY